MLRMVATDALGCLQELGQFGFFKSPVRGVDVHEEVVEFPIDFSAIRRRLQCGLYGSIGHVGKDVQFLCVGAMKFNAPGDVYYERAK